MPKEEKKKMSKKKKWLIGIGVVLVIVFIGSMGGGEEEPATAEISEEDQAEIDRQQKEHDEREAAKAEEEKAQEEKEAEEQAAAEEEEETVSTVEVNETFSFSEYTVTLEDVEIEDGNATLNMQFKNDSWPEGLSFMQSVGLDVYQNDELLDETSDEYTTGLGSNNGIFYKHDTGIYSHLDLSYGPIVEGEPIRIVFVPLLSEQDDSQEITIELE